MYHLNFIRLENKSIIQQSIDKILNKNKINVSKLIISLETDTIDKLKSAVQAGLGVAFVPYLTVETELKQNLFQTIQIKNTHLQQQLSILNLRLPNKPNNFTGFYHKFWHLITRISKHV
mmetsp:Transcript_25844/g.39607  ORF Transcript_25844/g.39607 Transcript_25844/m.39607 type:complete len:119 (+) Transcript_25844:68-424(+)